MPHPIIQTLLALLAGAAAWMLWRKTCGAPLVIALVTGGAVLIRAVAGQALFWISYLRLPVASSLQIGNGLWFFASDGVYYFMLANARAPAGLRSVLLISGKVSSVFFQQVFGLFIWLFGAVPSVGLLLNIFAVIGTMALIVVWARHYAVPWQTTALPLLAVGYTPSWILWSLQPLKDTFFCFLIILFAFALDLWVRSWREEGLAGMRMVAALTLPLTVYALAGMRWYYALVVLVVGLLPIASIAIGRLNYLQRAMRVGAVVLLVTLMTMLLIASAGSFLPEAPGRNPNELTVIAGSVEGSRQSFELARNGGTHIEVGENLRKRQTTRGTRLLTGLFAATVPRFAGSRLGLFSVPGGGRGLWWFADADTLWLDLLLTLIVVCSAKGLKRGAWRDPLVWFLALMSILMAGGLAYVVTNFGSLFRHREMILATAALIPLFAARAEVRTDAGAPCL